MGESRAVKGKLIVVRSRYCTIHIADLERCLKFSDKAVLVLRFSTLIDQYCE